MKKTKQEKGITLVALIITIIVLLILAVVTIRAVQGDGIIRYAPNASDKYTDKINEEQGILKEYADRITTEVTEVNSKLNPSGVIPEGGIYYSNVEICTCGSNTNLEMLEGEHCAECNFAFDLPTKYEAGDNFPTPSARDLYQYGDYEYCFGYAWAGYNDFWIVEINPDVWTARYIVKTKENPGPLLESIAGKPLESLNATYYGSSVKDARNLNIPKTVVDLTDCFANSSLEYPPVISEGVISMYYTFGGCTNLKEAPIIPSSVNSLGLTFYDCLNLSGIVTINANPTAYDMCFNASSSCKDITLTGSSTMLQKIAKTSGEYHHRVFDADGNILQGWE